MHKQLVNELRLWFSLRPAGPLLIKSGKGGGAAPMLLDMNFVRVHHGELGDTVYLPGSSLKGTLRSYSEKIARTVNVFCCDPLGKESCGQRLERQRGLDSAKKYQELCTICRIFGHMPVASHVRFSDAYPQNSLVKEFDQKLRDDTNRTEERDGVAIDRVSGAVAVGPFQLEVVTRGEFFGQLHLRNFQLWQVGLLTIALRDIHEGLVPIGFAKSRGLGQVQLNYQRLEISYPGQMGALATQRLGNKLAGVTSFNVTNASAYDFEPEEMLELNGGSVEAEWGRVTTRYDNVEAIRSNLRATVPAWANYVAHRQRQAA